MKRNRMSEYQSNWMVVKGDLVHKQHKYISKHTSKSGKTVYVYPSDSSGGSKKGKTTKELAQELRDKLDNKDIYKDDSNSKVEDDVAYQALNRLQEAKAATLVGRSQAAKGLKQLSKAVKPSFTDASTKAKAQRFISKKLNQAASKINPTAKSWAMPWINKQKVKLRKTYLVDAFRKSLK